jgi:hypothetical protein
MSEVETPQVVNLSQASVGSVNAELVRASNSHIRHLQAEEADLSHSAVVSGRVGNLKARQTFVGAVQAQQAELTQAMVGGVRAENITLTGRVGFVSATNVRAGEVFSAGAVASAKVEAPQVRTGVLIARQVNGNVETWLDARSAALFGAAAGATVGLILLAGKLLFGKK